MITATHIVPTLEALDAAYQNAPDIDAERLAKLAIIELCGWIEESMDDLVLRCSRRHLKVTVNQETCRAKVIGKTYGFDYHKHFRNMLIQVVGLIGVERLEKDMDQAKLAVLKSSLGTLKSIRDTVAHTHIKGTTSTLSAPSVMLNNFRNVRAGLMELDRTMRMGGF